MKKGRGEEKLRREREQERERLVGVIILRSVRFSSNVMRLSVTPLRVKKKKKPPGAVTGEEKEGTNPFPSLGHHSERPRVISALRAST